MAEADTINPVLRSLSFPTTVDVTNGGQYISFTAGATDVGMGVSNVHVSFSRSWQGEYGNTSAFVALDSVDSFADGTSSRQHYINPASSSGTYTIQQVYVHDKAGNYTQYTGSQLASMGIQTSFTIASNHQADTTKPILTSLSFPSTVDVTTGGQYISFTAGATDEGSGVDNVYVAFSQSWQGSDGNNSTFLVMDAADSFADGTSSKQYYVSPASGAGTYTIQQVYVHDKAGNYSSYTGSQLAGMGIQNSFTIVDQSVGPTATIVAPASIAEDGGKSLSLSVVLPNVSQASGTVTMSFSAAQSTVTNGTDVSVPSYVSSYQIVRVPAGDYTINLPSISIFADQLAEGTETIAVTIRVTGQTFDTGSDTKTVLVKLIDSGQTGGAGSDNLTGSPFGDDMTGGGGGDILNGGAGNDRIDGGDGYDTAVYSIARSAATITRNENGSLTVHAGADGTDTLWNVEQLQFSDGVLTLRERQFAQPGNVLLQDFAVGAGGWTKQDLYPRHVADVNDDGYGDIIGFGYSGTLVSYGSASGTFTAPALILSNFGQTEGWTSDNLFHRELADVNGDGRADIIGFGSTSTLISLAQTDGSYSSPLRGLDDFGTATGWATQDGFARTVGDVNGDGKIDLVGFGVSGTFVAIGKGDGTFDQVSLATHDFGTSQGWTSDDRFHRAMADVNGDGKADIIGFGSAGTLVALSNGDGSFGTARLVLEDFGQRQGWLSQDGFARTVTDVNDDGFADIVGFGKSGTYVAYGQASGGFSSADLSLTNFGADQGWTSNSSYHRELADIDNDGLADIVGFGFAGVMVGLNLGGDWLI